MYHQIKLISGPWILPFKPVGPTLPFATQEWSNDIFDASCWMYGSEDGGISLDRLQNSSHYPEDPERETVWFGHVGEGERGRRIVELGNVV